MFEKQRTKPDLHF